MKPKDFEYFVDALKALPTISTKSANKIAYFLLAKDEAFFNMFLNRLTNLKTNVKFCLNCNNLVVDDLYCEICTNPNRDKNVLCVVTTCEDLEKIEQTNSFFGLYYVLQNEVNHKNLKSADLIDLTKFEKMIKNFNPKEILFCTNVTIDGELTCAYLKNFLKEKKYKIDLFRLGLGIPVNAAIEYIDWQSLKYSIANKTKIE